MVAFFSKSDFPFPEENGKEKKTGALYGSFFCLLFFSKKSELVLIAARVHPFPFRTRKLSSFALKILGWKRPGKIGSANTMGSL